MKPRLAVVALLVLACGPRDAAIRRQRAAAETRHLAESFDRLEERMLATQARVRLWKELRDRHESVSAIACASQDEHAAEMAAHHVLPAPSRRRGPVVRARVAAAASGAPATRVPAAAAR